MGPTDKRESAVERSEDARNSLSGGETSKPGPAVAAPVPAWVVWVVLAFGLLAIFVVFQFNRMVTLRHRCRESWANVDAELQRRHDLVPNLVAAVQGAMKHERGVLEAVTQARTQVLAAKGPASLAPAEGRLVQAMDRLLAVAEGYPKLQASRIFLSLQHELAVTEDRIQAARRFYNGNVRDHRDQVRQFPGSLVAGAFGFREIAFWEVPSVHVRAAPAVRLA